MVRTLSFFCINEGVNAGWYADVPGHTLEDNQMISGSDEFLQGLDDFIGGRGHLEMTFSDCHDVTGPAFKAKLLMRDHDSEGATYVVTGPIAEQNGVDGFQIWICNVTHDVMGEHPRCIYIYDVR